MGIKKEYNDLDEFVASDWLLKRNGTFAKLGSLGVPLHDHLGEGKTLERLRQSFHWYGMGGDVQLYIQRCRHCNACKVAGPTKRAKLQNYQAGAPMDRIHIDILGPFPVSSSGNKYVLIIIDQFTRWVEAFPVPDQGAETTAKTLVYEFISRFGAPLELHTDQGQNFESSLFRNVCSLLQITKRGQPLTILPPMGKLRGSIECSFR